MLHECSEQLNIKMLTLGKNGYGSLTFRYILQVLMSLLVFLIIKYNIHNYNYITHGSIETFGGWGLESRPVFATLADRISGRTGQAKSCVINQLYQRLAITLQRQHACAMIARHAAIELFFLKCITYSACTLFFLIILLINNNNNNNNNNNY